MSGKKNKATVGCAGIDGVCDKWDCPSGDLGYMFTGYKVLATSHLNGGSVLAVWYRRLELISVPSRPPWFVGNL